MLVSVPESHSLLLEWKSGPNFEPDQLRRYAGVKPDDLRLKASVPASAYTHHDCVLVGREDCRERLELGVTKAKCSFPLILVSDKGLALGLNSFGLPALSVAFTPMLGLDPRRAPTHFVPFDTESPDWIIAERVIQSVVEAMHKHMGRVTARGIAMKVLPFFEILAAKAQTAIVKDIDRVLKKAASMRFSAYLRHNKTASGSAGGPTFDIIANPLKLEADKRSREFHHLLRLQKEFIADLKMELDEGEQLKLPMPESGDKT